MMIDYLCLKPIISYTQRIMYEIIGFKYTHEEEEGFQQDWNRELESDIYTQRGNDDNDDVSLTRDTCRPLIGGNGSRVGDTTPRVQKVSSRMYG